MLVGEVEVQLSVRTASHSVMSLFASGDLRFGKSLAKTTSFATVSACYEAPALMSDHTLLNDDLCGISQSCGLAVRIWSSKA